MPRFFIDYVPDGAAVITGGDAQHIAHALRMRRGEKLVLCDCLGMDYDGEIERIEPGGTSVLVRILGCCQSVSEPSLRVTLYQALPKQDKFDTVVQKAVELGVYRIVPVLSARCVSRPDEKAFVKKRQRWQKIADEAAKQSGRGILPQIGGLKKFPEAIEEAAAEEGCKTLLFDEGGGERILSLLREDTPSAAVFIGPEGGFEPGEVALARHAGAACATLGPRILRTETAPIAALAAIMQATGNL